MFCTRGGAGERGGRPHQPGRGADESAGPAASKDRPARRGTVLAAWPAAAVAWLRRCLAQPRDATRRRLLPPRRERRSQRRGQALAQSRSSLPVTLSLTSADTVKWQPGRANQRKNVSQEERNPPNKLQTDEDGMTPERLGFRDLDGALVHDRLAVCDR